MTQKEMLLRYLQEFGGITQAEAIDTFGCYRLSARIADLKKDGYEIDRTMETKLNRYGEPVTFARYRLGAAK